MPGLEMNTNGECKSMERERDKDLYEIMCEH